MKKIFAILVLSLLWSLNTYAVEKKNLTVVQEIKQLGVFSEPSKYPEGMIEFFGTGCKNFTCRANKATKKMALTFKRTKLYHQRRPGHQLYALAMFELFYLNELKKKKKELKNFLSVGLKKIDMEKR